MAGNQLKYIEYLSNFAESNKSHIWLGGSFLKECATAFSDVDISVCCDVDRLSDLIYGYGEPVYISYTSNPLGILIIIYEDGVALDMEIVKEVDIANNEYFHRADIKKLNYVRVENVCRQFAIDDDIPYQMSRLFHRSLIKFLSGKRDIGVSVANEIVSFMNLGDVIDETGYKNRITDLLKKYNEKYPLQSEYYKLLAELMEKV